MLRLYRVAGESMRPALRPGDIVLAVTRFRPREGLVVIADGAGGRTIKRLGSRIGERWELRGDNRTLSLDSRQLGPVSPAALRGRVVLRVRMP